MLSDRTYMRDVYGHRGTSVLTWIISASVGAFILENIFVHWFRSPGLIYQHFALSWTSIRSGEIWTLLTYSLLHGADGFGLMSLIVDVLGLYFLGRELLALMGARRFVGLYIGALILGGLAWTAFHYQTGSILLGASAALFALLVVYALFYPNQRMTFLLFFVIPVTVKPKHLAWFFAGVDLCGFLFYEIMGQVSPFGVAHSAHLGGMLAGLIYYRFVHQTTAWDGPAKASIELPRWLRRTPKSAAAKPSYHVTLSNRDTLRAEVDRILDKINSSGFGALTPEEKRILDEAKDLLSRH